MVTMTLAQENIVFKEHYIVTLALEGEIDVIEKFKTDHDLDFAFGETTIGASTEHPTIGLARLELFTHEGTQDETNSMLGKWINSNCGSVRSLKNVNKTVMVNTFTRQEHAYSWFKFTPETIEAINQVHDLHLSVMTYRIIENES